MLRRATLALLLVLAATLPARAQNDTLTVFAAASMKNAVDDINAAFTKATGIKVVSSYAAVSALAKQIEAGAPADVFASADLEWMDYVAQQEAHQGRHARQPARQSAGADRAEGFQDRQRDHRPGLRSRQARRRRPHRHRRRARGAGRQIRQGRAGEARLLDGGGAEVRHGRKRARRADAGRRAARRRSASSTRPTPRSSRT